MSGKPVFSLLRDIPPAKPRDEIVEGLIGRGEIALLTGAPKSGKSLLACALVASITNGDDFLGRSTARGTAIYLAAERGVVVHRRLEVAGADPDATALAMTPINLVEEVGELMSAIRSVTTDPVLIVIDTLARVTLGIEENSARDMGRVVAALGRIQVAFPRSAILVIHHTGKSAAATARGSGALLAGADVELRVDRNKLTVSAANAVECGQELPFSLGIAPLSDGTTEAIILTSDPLGQMPEPLRKRQEEQALVKDYWVERISEMHRAGMTRDLMEEKLAEDGFFKDCKPSSRRVRLDRYLKKYARYSGMRTAENNRESASGVRHA